MIERRTGKRFQVDWPVRLEGTDEDGSSFTHEGVLQNISSGGALLTVPRALPPGARLDVFIRLPFKGKWMKYGAYVIRTQSGGSPLAAAVKFEVPKPEFAAVPASR